MTHLQNLVTEPSSLFIIRFQDCDPFGHLNNARCVDYFLNARQDHLVAHYNLRIYEPNDPAHASGVIKKTQIAYLRPALVMEQVLIRTRLIHFTDKTLMLEGLMLDQATNHLKSIIWVEFVYVSLLNGRPINHPQDLLDLCRAIVVPIDYNPDQFNKRVELVSQQFRKHPKPQEMPMPAAPF